MPIALSDFAAWFGWGATILMTANVVLGVLQPMRYDPTLRWPHRRLPASLFRLHKWIGYTALGVVLAHPLFLLAHKVHPFTLGAIYVPFRAPVEVVWAGLGTLAFYILVAVVGTSFFRASIGLRWWKLAHYASYALLPLMIVHGVFVDPDLNEATAIDYVDAGKLIAEACGLLTIAASVWRLRYHLRARAGDRSSGAGGAAAAPWRGALTVVDIVSETPAIKTLRLAAAADDAVPFEFEAGQYLRLDGIRNYTIASPPSQRDSLDISVKAEADGFYSLHLHRELRVGDLVAVRGPLGHFVLRAEREAPILMIAGGVGVTPFLSMLPALLEGRGSAPVTLVYSVRGPGNALRLDQLKRLETLHPRFRLVMVYTREAPDGHRRPIRRITAEMLLAVMPSIASAQVYLCGPDPMMADIADMLASLGVPEDAIFAESFGAARPDLRPA